MAEAPYFITGYERSRTAWLANLLSTGPSFCWHDLLRVVPPKRVRLHLDQTRAWYPGISDTGYPLFWREVGLDADDRVVVVERDPGEALAASMAAFGVPDTQRPVMERLYEAIGKELEVLKTRVRTLVVPYTGLDEESVVRDVWRHCLPPTFRWDHDRWVQLRDMKVTVVGPRPAGGWCVQRLRDVLTRREGV